MHPYDKIEISTEQLTFNNVQKLTALEVCLGDESRPNVDSKLHPPLSDYYQAVNIYLLSMLYKPHTNILFTDWLKLHYVPHSSLMPHWVRT